MARWVDCDGGFLVGDGLVHPLPGDIKPNRATCLTWPRVEYGSAAGPRPFIWSDRSRRPAITNYAFYVADAAAIAAAILAAIRALSMALSEAGKFSGGGQ